jgi:hypothetical protein
MAHGPWDDAGGTPMPWGEGSEAEPDLPESGRRSTGATGQRAPEPRTTAKNVFHRISASRAADQFST